MNKPVLGCIADDLTGASDLANNLVRAGMRVVLTVDLPAGPPAKPADAIVVALKSRTIPAADAVKQSLGACRWLRAEGVKQIYFKICSTFDSTPAGNIGPVIEALMDELNCDFSAVVPSFPDAERTVYRGHLFVGNELLNESGMRNHPLTPMTDANLVRWLQRQLRREKKRRTGLIDYRSVARSSEAIREKIDTLCSSGTSIAIADTLSDDDLYRLAAALRDHPVITAGSGLAIALPKQWGFQASPEAAHLPTARGRRAIVSGSCSVATNTQVREFVLSGGKALSLDPARLADENDEQIEKAVAWVADCWSGAPNDTVLVYSTAPPDSVRAMHERFGIERIGTLVERAMAGIARRLVEAGAGQLIIAGGETAGECIRALGIEQMQIGPQIDPGVPWCFAQSPLVAHSLHLALKSGNFGSKDFFTKAFNMLH